MRVTAQITGFVLLFASISEATGQTFESLLAKTPASANVVAIFDVESTLSTPLAQKEGWGKKLELAYVQRPVYLPPEASKLVLAASMDAANDFRRNWEMGVMELSEPVPLRSIARTEGGYLDEVGDVPVVWTPSNAYFVSFADQTLGIIFPANRQFVGRWIEYAQSNTEVELSDYLATVVPMTSRQVQILLAIDLTNLIQPHELDDHVRQSDLFKKAQLTSEEAVPLITSLRGAMLRIAIDEQARGELRIDFGKDLAPLEPILKELVLETMSELGAEITDLESWKVEVRGTAMRMVGPLSQSALRRVFSIVELPSAKFSLLKDEGQSAEDGEPGRADEPNESLIRETSLTYFRSVDVLLKDLKRDLRGNKASAAIMERYAGRIDRMPILHVDEALLDYGADVAETLRMVALAKRQGGIQAGVATAGMGGSYSNYSYNYGWGASGDRYESARQSAADRTALKAQALAQSQNMRVEGAKLIADSTAAIRRAMTQKYQVEF